jgi:hypothetical protein
MVDGKSSPHSTKAPPSLVGRARRPSIAPWLAPRSLLGGFPGGRCGSDSDTETARRRSCAFFHGDSGRNQQSSIIAQPPSANGGEQKGRGRKYHCPTTKCQRGRTEGARTRVKGRTVWRRQKRRDNACWPPCVKRNS